jgi:hypothetical protein
MEVQGQDLRMTADRRKECGVNGGSQKSSGLDEILG